MTEFQKIAIGLLGRTHPEIFIVRQKGAQQSTGKLARKADLTEHRREGRGARWLRALRFMLDALAIGSRTVALADNSELRRDLRVRARVYGLDGGAG